MAYALIANTAAESADSANVTTPAINTTGANLIVIIVNRLGAQTLSDNKGNTWTPVPTTYGSSPGIQIFYALNPTVGSGHTFSYGGGAPCFPSIFVSAWSGAAASSVLDQENGNSGNASTLQTGSVTPGADNELMIAGVGSENEGTTYSINGGFTITNQVDGAAGLAYGGAMAYLIQTSATAANPTWTLSGSASVSAAIATFKAAGGGGGNPWYYYAQLQ